MATAQIVEFEEQTGIDPQGATRQELVPRFSLDPLSGTFTTEPIPRDQFTRDLAEQRVRTLAQELLSPEADVTVQFPG
jgi:hypothetical protein